MVRTLWVCSFSFSCASGAQTLEGLRHPSVDRTYHHMDVAHLRSARALFDRDNALGFSLRSNFTSLFGGLHGSTDPLSECISRQLSFATHDFWMMSTGLDRLAWMAEKAKSDPLLLSKWSSYATLDIEQWHIQFRSLLDYTARVIRELAAKKGQVSDSFTKLQKHSMNATGDPESERDFSQRLGADWLRLLQNAGWYSQIVQVRDEVVHFGAQTIVFDSPAEGILFQVRGAQGARLARDLPGLMFNKNVVYFERYAAHFMAHLLVWLEAFAAIAYQKLRIPQGSPTQNVHFGFETLTKWIDSALSKLVSASKSEMQGIQGMK